jgi:hypothetical protein
VFDFLGEGTQSEGCARKRFNLLSDALLLAAERFEYRSERSLAPGLSRVGQFVGAHLCTPPIGTPLGSINARLDAPAGSRSRFKEPETIVLSTIRRRIAF